MVRRGSASTLASQFREAIRRDITVGALRPGEHLKPAALAKQYNTSTTVIRESLAKLASEKLVVAQPNQGYFVLSLALNELEDLTRVRVHCDSLALELAIERGDIAWETTLMTKHHVLSRTPRRSMDDPNHTTEAWSRAHRDFHLSLIQACGVPLLLDVAAATFDSTELYRRWAAPSAAAGKRSIDAEHAEIMQAALARDTGTAIGLLREHYERSLQIILDSGLDLAATPGQGGSASAPVSASDRPALN